jgi:hypothetical protein
MNSVSYRRRVATRAILATACCLAALAGVASAQQGYGSYYGQQARKQHGQLGTESVGRYLYDQYFYKRPSVSPYVNLDRPDPYGGTSYQAYVRPEQQRREATMRAQGAYIDARKREGRVGDTRFPGATYGGVGTAILKPVPQRKSTPSAYHNHWYGGWANR